MEINERYKNLLDAIEAERQQEERYYKELAKTRTIPQRLDSGLLWWPIRVGKTQFGMGGVVEVEIERTKSLGEPHKMKVGAGVRIFKEGRDHEYKGVVAYLRKDSATVIVTDEKVLNDNDIQYGNVGLELVYDERPYKVMKEAIIKVMTSKDIRIQDLRKAIDQIAILDDKWRIESHPSNVSSFLNDSQKNAIINISNAGSLGIIHGPPGTGKTTTLVALIQQLVKTEKKILVCAPSNNAVDLLARLIDEKGIPTIRIGNISRIGDEIAHLSIGEKARNHHDWKHIKKVRIEAQEALKMADQHKRKFGEQQRNERKNMRFEAKELRKWARELEDRLIELLMDEAKVICTTLIGASAKAIEENKYSTLIIDEASQALEPECWNAMLKADRTILAGDHLQLSPVVKSDSAKKLGLGVTLLDRMSGKINFDYMLKVQYRMHESILQFSNAQFYDNKLLSDEKVKFRCIPNDTHTVQFIDTSGCGFYEEFDQKKRSYRNSQEYFILREYLLTQKEKQLPYSIGIISPYASQVNYIRTEIIGDKDFEGMDIQVDTVDGFQGQEKDVIYISFVRSNDQANVGFLADERRLNVAMTRAKLKLVMVGDLSTLSSNKLFNDLAKFIESNDFYRSAWEFMSY